MYDLLIYVNHRIYNTGGCPPSELYDAHACGKEDAALQAACTRRSGSLCGP